MTDVLGQAIADYFYRKGKSLQGKLWVNNKYGPREEMPVKTYFRSADDMPDLEWDALQLCKGSVLDIGAGAGSHALVLQDMGLDVTALDISPKAAAVMAARGVKHILNEDFFLLANRRFDTLLLMMNGIGLAATLDGLRTFFDHARSLLAPDGCLIFDSSDISYLYQGKPPSGEEYYGEILYQYEYRGECSDWFKWLFIDRKTLGAIALEKGWKMELLSEDGFDQFLVRCTIIAP